MKINYLLKNIAVVYVVLFVGLLMSCHQREQQVPTSATNDAVIEDSLPQFIIPKPDSLFILSYMNENPGIKNLAAGIFEFYSKRNYECAWFNEYGLTEQSGKVVNLVRDYLQSGIVDTTVLIPGVVEYYDSITTEAFTPSGNEALILRAEVLFTAQFLWFSEKAWKGIRADKIKKLDWFLPLNSSSQIDYLNTILSPDTKVIEGTEPVFRQFLLLKAKVKNYAGIAVAGGWGIIPQLSQSLKAGDTSDIIISVRKRLIASGDFVGDSASNLLDAELAEHLAIIRDCYGLSTDTVIDSKLINELNVPVQQRLQQMLINLERWKWIPADPGLNFIAVNIPEYKLHVFENGKLLKSMKVIVGKTVNQTVIFSGDLKYVVLSPYWIIPRSIIVKETLPALKKNPEYLSKHNMEIVTNASPPEVIPVSRINFSEYNSSNFPYSIRQKPGPSNSLGYVKFLFPNSYSIYLHDTPSRNLFEESARSFSHGCIRISEPAWLAEYLLRNNENWSPEKIKQAMYGGNEKYVTIKETIPVYITYFTSWVDASGRLNFRKDIYGHDKKLAKELFQ